VKQEGLKERVELLEIGEKLGYPRLGYGRSTKIPHDKRIPAGQHGWETFCAHAHVRRILPALRIGRVLRDNNVQVFHPLSNAEMAQAPDTTATSGHVPTDLLDDFPELHAPDPPTFPLVTLPRPKKGGHKKPPRPGTKRWLAEQARLSHG